MSAPAHRPVGYRARAKVDSRTVADSDAARRVDRPGAAPELWFPRHDVDAAVLGEGGSTAWLGTGDLADHVTFDASTVDLEVVDGRPGDDPRDVTVKRFPTWGDAAELIEILDVEPAGGGVFHARGHDDWRRPVVEGSQILGQAVVAAGRLAPDRRVVAASMSFVRAADAGAGYTLGLDEVSAGRTFTSLLLRAEQAGRVCAIGTALLDVTAPDLIRHAVDPPSVPGPYDSAPVDMAVTGRDLRVVDDAYTGDPEAPAGPAELDAWVRFRDVPDDPPIHAGLLAQFTGHMSIAAAMRPHVGVGQDQAHRTLSSAINAISLAVHGPVRADEWLLYHHRSTFAGDGMTHAECRVHDRSGSLVASFTVDAMVRGFADPAQAADERTAL